MDIDSKHPSDNQVNKTKASKRLSTPIGRMPTSYVYGVNYPAGWLFWKDGEERKDK